MDQHFFRTPFCLSGNKQPIPNDSQPSGDVSYTDGFTLNYELPDGDPGSKDVPRQESNELYFAITENIQQYQTVGTPEWITAADNDGVNFPYPAGARVRYDAGGGAITYISQIDLNTSTPGDNADWFVEGARVGETIFWDGPNAPAGRWLLKDGAAVSRTIYAALFAIYGETYGPGDGVTTFNLPDDRGLFPRVTANGSVNDPDRATRSNRGDGVTGDNVGTLQGFEVQAHNHPFVSGDRTTREGGGGNDWGNDDSGSSLFRLNSASTANRGGSETRPINKYFTTYVGY